MHRHGFTLLELLLVCTLIGVATSIAVPAFRAPLDRLGVESATRDVMSAFAVARWAALQRGGIEVRIDSMSVRVSGPTGEVLRREVGARHGVRLRATPGLVRYGGTGVAIGLSNGTIVLTRGRAADTIVISRLGRVRR